MASRTTDNEAKPRLIVMGPVPPPAHGVAVSTRLALENPLLRDRFEIEHVDTSDRRPIDTMERWDATNVVLGLKNLAQLAKRIGRRKGVVYLPLSQTVGAFLRDSLFIHTAALAGWKIAVHYRNSTFPEFYEGSSPVLRSWIRLTLKRVSSLAVLGISLRTIFDGLVPGDRISVVPNGTPDVARNGALMKPNRVLYLSNLLEKKGIVEAVEAALIIVQRNPDAEVLFAGEWRNRALEGQLRARAEPAGNRVRFLPPVAGDEKEELLQSCSVLLFPPIWGEGHPRIVLEAICRGIPLVTTDRATIPDTVTDGESAFVLDGADPTRLAERVIQLLDDPQLRERMGKAARARYEADYTQERADQRLADWLTQVAG